MESSVKLHIHDSRVALRLLCMRLSCPPSRNHLFPWTEDASGCGGRRLTRELLVIGALVSPTLLAQLASWRWWGVCVGFLFSAAKYRNKSNAAQRENIIFSYLAHAVLGDAGSTMAAFCFLSRCTQIVGRQISAEVWAR